MRKLLAISILALLSACGGKEPESTKSENILKNLTVSVDTVMVDSKEKLFELNWGPLSSSVSEDGKYLFLFNSKFSQIQQINLDKLAWEKDITFEVEGPNGISKVVSSTQTLGGGKFLISSYRKMGIFNDEGVKLKDYSISSLPITSELEELDNSIILSKDQKSLFSLPGIRYYEPRTLAKIDLQTSEVVNFPLKEMDWISDLKIRPLLSMYLKHTCT